MFAVYLDFHVDYLPSARTAFVGCPVSVGDDGGTLCGTVTDGNGEVYVFQELLHLLIERCTAYDNLIESAAKGIIYLLADFLLYLCSNDRCLHQQTNSRSQFREHLLADNLLDDEWYGDDDDWLDICESLCHNCWGGDAGEIVDVASAHELLDKFKRHTIHVSHRQNGYGIVAWMQLAIKHEARKVQIRPKGAIGYHDAFGEAGSA